MQVQLFLTPGYRLKISRAFRLSELLDRTLTSLAALGGSAAFLEILRPWLQRRRRSTKHTYNSMLTSWRKTTPYGRLWPKRVDGATRPKWPRGHCQRDERC